MKKLFILIAAVLIALPALGLCDTFSFRVGYYFPKADSDLWQTQFENLTLTRADYQSAMFGLSYEHSFNPFFSLEVAADYYSRSRSGFYKDYEGISFADGDFAFNSSQVSGDFSLVQTFSVSILPIQLNLKITPLGRRGWLIPYFGGGAALNIWSVRIFGDMVDFSQPTPFVTDSGDTVTGYPTAVVDARDTHLAVSYQAFAGVMYPVGGRMSVDAGFKYFIGQGDLKKIQGFQPVDLNGFLLFIGFNYWF